MGVLIAAPVAPFPGRWVITLTLLVGGMDAVLKLLLKSARWLPARSVTPLVTTTVITAGAGRVAESVTVRLSAERLRPNPITDTPLNNPKVVELIVFGFKGLENVRVTAAFWPTP